METNLNSNDNDNQLPDGTGKGEELVRLKGSRSGLTLEWSPGADGEAVLGEIRRRLESGTKFFRRGTVVRLKPEMLSREQTERLRGLCDEYGVLVKLLPPPLAAAPSLAAAPPKTDEPHLPAFAANALRKPLVIDGTVRGGREIKNLGSVLVNGNVNAGALIMAGGNIEVRGWCRGVVHAGFLGDRHAYVVADRLEPTQIRIADLISPGDEWQAPPAEGRPARTERGGHARGEAAPRRAYIRGGRIVVEAIDPQADDRVFELDNNEG